MDREGQRHSLLTARRARRRRMERLAQVREELARRLQQCLDEAGVPAEVAYMEQEAVVHGKSELDGKPLRVLAVIASHEVKLLDCGPELLLGNRSKASVAAIRPTLRIQPAAAQIAGEKLTAGPEDGGTDTASHPKDFGVR
jgi:hypothetical protein